MSSKRCRALALRASLYLALLLIGPIAHAQAPQQDNALPVNAGSSQSAPSPAADTPPAPSTKLSTPETSPGSLTMLLLPRDLSPWGMFHNADWLVQSVMVGLAFASVLTWTIALAKWLELLGFKARLRKAHLVIAARDR